MIIRILVIILVCIIVVFVGFWIFSGGLSRGFSVSRLLDNPFNYFLGTTTGAALSLPGQPDYSNFGPDISQYMDSVSGSGSVSNPGQGAAQNAQGAQLNELQDRYDALYAQANDAKNFGNPSPYRNKVTFSSNSAQGSSPNTEYVTLQADYQNTAPISLAGWSLQSAVTGIRSPLPQGATSLILGVLNTVSSVTLDPGAFAIVVSGPSPVGVSFRENLCAGYLAELQTFTPDLDRSCPMAEDDLPLNAQNIQAYGDACIDTAKNLQQCHFPGLDAPQNVSPACNTFLLNRFSYNGCVYAHRNDRQFAGKSWRLYLASGVQLWRDTHDIVRLLDDQGRTVDVLTY